MTPEEFKAMRLKLGYETRGDLAKAMGITRYAIEHYEYGRRPIPKWAEKLLECLAALQTIRKMPFAQLDRDCEIHRIASEAIGKKP
jgi:transcriptional regulator with XRE-family HTH domain